MWITIKLLTVSSADLFLHDLLTSKQSENMTSLAEVITINNAGSEIIS